MKLLGNGTRLKEGFEGAWKEA